MAGDWVRLVVQHSEKGFAVEWTAEGKEKPPPFSNDDERAAYCSGGPKIDAGTPYTCVREVSMIPTAVEFGRT